MSKVFIPKLTKILAVIVLLTCALLSWIPGAFFVKTNPDGTPELTYWLLEINGLDLIATLLSLEPNYITCYALVCMGLIFYLKKKIYVFPCLLIVGVVFAFMWKYARYTGSALD
jgi:hypothetical protein